MCHVLIIEDEWLIAYHISLLLEDAGATSIMIADCEEDAVACAMDRLPLVIISDVNLRSGTGPGAVARIADAVGDCEVIFVTGSPEQCPQGETGAEILLKPVADHLLVSAFQRAANFTIN